MKESEMINTRVTLDDDGKYRLREYGVDEKTGTVFIQETLIGETDADGSPSFLLSWKAPVPESGQRTITVTLSPRELRGTAEREHTTTYYNRAK